MLCITFLFIAVFTYVSCFVSPPHSIYQLAQLSNKLFFWRHIKFFNEAYFVATYTLIKSSYVTNLSIQLSCILQTKAYNWYPKEENEVTFVD